jgi:hypothetical protein
MILAALFAQQQQQNKGSPFDRPEIILGSAALVGALLLGAFVIYLVDRWRKQTALADRQEGLELTDYREMFESGEITEAEYNKLRLKVADRVKKVEAPAPVAVPAQAPPAAPPVAGPFPPGYFFDDPSSKQ